MKYNLIIGNKVKDSLFVLLLIAWTPLVGLIIYQIDSSFIKVHTIIAFSIILIPLIISLLLWSRPEKRKDVFELTDKGIETEKHGIIKWQDIDKCSWKSNKAGISINLKLKNNTRLFIAPSFIWENNPKGYDDFRIFFNEIKRIRENLPEKDKFKILEGRISKVLVTGLIIFFAVLLLIAITFSVIYKK